MSTNGDKRPGFYGWLSNTLERYPSLVIMGTLLITAWFLVPLLYMAPTETASDNPTGDPVVQLYEKIDDTFPSEVYWMPFVAEAKGGDILTQDSLYELYQRERELQESELAPFLYDRYLETAGVTVEGVYSIADAVDSALLLQSGGGVNLSNATDEQVKQAIASLVDDPAFRDDLSVKAEHGEDGWTSPALIFFVMADDEKVREEYPRSVDQDYSGDIVLEHFGRAVQDILRGDESEYELWGIGIDLNLEIEDESGIAAILTAVAMVLISILIFIIFRSWFITLVTTAGLGMLIIWLKGFSNLVGLKGSLTLDLIVPIAIVVLGVDYAIQALFRYREETERGKPPPMALGSANYLVSRALVLAMLTTVAAFSANASSGIESVIGFAVAASFAIFASLIILGFFVPTVVMQYQSRKGRRIKKSTTADRSRPRGAWMGRLISGTSNLWFISIPLILIVTGFAAWGWLNVETKMDAKDALDPGSDFVIGLDKVDEHMAETGGEPAVIYIEGDLTRLEALDAMKAFIEELDDNQHVARSPIDDSPDPSAFLLDMLEVVIQVDYAAAQVEQASGVEITDNDNDFIPDTSEQLEAVYDYALDNGVPRDEDTLIYSPKHIEEAFVRLDNGGDTYATMITIGIPGTREQEIVRLSSNELNDDMETAMEGVEGIDSYGLTGTGYVRLVQFDAIANSLTRSLIIAAAVVLLLLVIVFRSLRFAVMTIIPVLLVACWLYGFMYVAGYYLNALTATIAAIAIGVGIDFSVHFTERYRQEMGRRPYKRIAISRTARTTGFALFYTALTTAIGFAVIAFAPMPIFATFGLLTAIMIVLSLLMALFALPSMLLLFAPGERSPKGKKKRRVQSKTDL
jgi:predicted RND superfamily exporter protein